MYISIFETGKLIPMWTFLKHQLPIVILGLWICDRVLPRFRHNYESFIPFPLDKDIYSKCAFYNIVY